ncbi:hypothetical protein EON65_43790 [archaeon]|nr:MAG: hypothetical protein EON65_43790 [archaeon]
MPMYVHITGSEKNLRSMGANSSSPVPSVSFGEGDLERMRGSIQALVQQTGPLGAVMDFLQEDLSLMNAELHKWEEEARRCEGEYYTDRNMLAHPKVSCQYY